MKPTWLSPTDLALHVAGGALLTAALTALGTPILGSLLSCLAVACVREFSEVSASGKQWSDFQPENSGPQNGLADCAAWLVGAGLVLGGRLLV